MSSTEALTVVPIGQVDPTKSQLSPMTRIQAYLLSFYLFAGKPREGQSFLDS
jgi:hypothetical protein